MGNPEKDKKMDVGMLPGRDIDAVRAGLLSLRLQGPVIGFGRS